MTALRPLLGVEDLALHYAAATGTVRAVDGVSFTLAQGEALGIVGESGAGKSSLGLALLRVLPRNVAALTGRVMLGGADCLGLDEGQFRRDVRWRQIAMVFQGALESLNPVMKAGEQIAEPLRASGWTRDAARKRVAQLLDMVRLPATAYDRYAHELSGGMKQRVVIAMALALQPSLLILDEPTSALDVSIQAQVMDLLKRLKAELGLTVLFITHDIALACDLCDRLAVMYAGELVEIGPIEDVITRPAHPYTQRLMASIPRLEGGVLPEFIPGAPPDLAHPPAGCRFHPRCPHAFERCRVEPPPAFAAAGPVRGAGAAPEASAPHTAHCWLLADMPRGGNGEGRA